MKSSLGWGRIWIVRRHSVSLGEKRSEPPPPTTPRVSVVKYYCAVQYKYSTLQYSAVQYLYKYEYTVLHGVLRTTLRNNEKAQGVDALWFEFRCHRSSFEMSRHQSIHLYILCEDIGMLLFFGSKLLILLVLVHPQNAAAWYPNVGCVNYYSILVLLIYIPTALDVNSDNDVKTIHGEHPTTGSREEGFFIMHQGNIRIGTPLSANFGQFKI